MDIHYFSYSCQKNKLTWTISYINKALINFHHDAPNSHVPGISIKTQSLLTTLTFEDKVFFSRIRTIQTEIGLLGSMLTWMEVYCYCYNSFKDFLRRSSVKNFRQKRDEVAHYLFFSCHEEEHQTSEFSKNNWYRIISTKSTIMEQVCT